jgi:hypothetical protein
MQWFIRWHSYCVFSERRGETSPVFGKQSINNLLLAEVTDCDNVLLREGPDLWLTSDCQQGAGNSRECETAHGSLLVRGTTEVYGPCPVSTREGVVGDGSGREPVPSAE